MKIIKDYLGYEIHEGDILLYNQRATKGYYSSFTEDVMIGTIGNGKIEVCDVDNLDEYKNENRGQWTSNYTDRKYGRNTINLTALGIRERIEL